MWTEQWGDKILFSHGTKAFNDRHWVACVLENHSVLIILVNVYAYNNDHKNRNLLHQVTTAIKELNTNFPTDYILAGGDFNLTPDE